MNLRPALKLAVILGLVLIFSCAAAYAKTEVKFAFWGSQEEVDLVQSLKETFEKDHPEIEIVLQHIPSDQFEQKLLIQIAGNDAPDVVTIREVSFSYFARRGFYRDLTPLVEKSDMDLNRFYPNVVDLYRLDGTLYGLPREFTPVVTYFNKDMFDEAGVPYPQDGWTWDDFVATAKKLTKDLDGDGKIDQWGTFMVPWDALYLPIVFSFDGNILSEDGTKSALTKPETIEAFQFATDLIHKYKVAPPLQEANSYGWINGFANGKFGMIFQGRWATPTYQGIEGVNWEVAPAPQGKKRATVLYSSGFGISATSKVPDAAFEWIKFLTSEEGQKIYGGPDALVVPANKQIANSDNFITPATPPAKDELFLSEAENCGHVPPQTPSFAEMYQIVNRYVNEVFLGLKGVEEGLQQAEQELNDMLEKKLRRLR